MESRNHVFGDSVARPEDTVTFIVEGDGDAVYDGFSWRKYGEKRIKRRAYSRSYYKCGHDGCKVLKQVERSSENPAEYLLIYHGRHNHYAITSFSSIGGGASGSYAR